MNFDCECGFHTELSAKQRERIAVSGGRVKCPKCGESSTVDVPIRVPNQRTLPLPDDRIATLENSPSERSTVPEMPFSMRSTGRREWPIWLLVVSCLSAFVVGCVTAIAVGFANNKAKESPFWVYSMVHKDDYYCDIKIVYRNPPSETAIRECVNQGYLLGKRNMIAKSGNRGITVRVIWDKFESTQDNVPLARAYCPGRGDSDFPDRIPDELVSIFKWSRPATEPPEQTRLAAFRYNVVNSAQIQEFVEKEIKEL